MVVVPDDGNGTLPATAATSSILQAGTRDGVAELNSSADTVASGSYTMVGTGTVPSYTTEANVVAEVTRLSSIVATLVSRVAALPPLRGGVGDAPPALLESESKQDKTDKHRQTDDSRRTSVA